MIVIVYWTTATLHSGTPTNPSLAHLLANRITLPVYAYKAETETRSTRPQDNSMLVGPIGRYTTGLF